MNDTLKAAGRIGAELGAAKAEVERLSHKLERARDHLTHARHDVEIRANAGNDAARLVLKGIDQWLSDYDQSPDDTYTAVDMATAAAQGFRDGQAAVEQATAQDEREIIGVERYRVEPTGRGFWPFCVRAGNGERELFSGHRKTCEQVAAELATAFEDGKFVAARPAQTEQQPVAYLDLGIGGYMDLGTDLTDEQLEGLPWGRHMLGIIGTYGAEGYAPAAPLAQTEQQPVAYVRFRNGEVDYDSDDNIVISNMPGDEDNGVTWLPVYAVPIAQAAPQSDPSSALADVAAERRRQIEAEGWTPEHDDAHNAAELGDAAACYALWAGGINPGNWSQFWPWDHSWLKHSEPRRMLVKAGALILAEIERLDRAALSAQGAGDADS